MKKISLVIVLMSMLSMSLFSQEEQRRLVGNTDDLTEIKIAKGSLYAFNRFIYLDPNPEKFTDIQLALNDSTYYLLALGESSKKLYAFELENIDKDIYLNPKLPLYRCPEATISLDSFKFEEREIKGCKIGELEIRKSALD